jgi:hypothetical protein
VKKLLIDCDIKAKNLSITIALATGLGATTLFNV